MYHNQRRWCVRSVESADDLVDKLLRFSWCSCTGFELEGHLWLNDSTSPDALQEYAVVRKPTTEDGAYRQVESITVSWCNRQQLLGHIEVIHHDGPQPAPDEGPVVRARSVGDLLDHLGATRESGAAVVHPQVETPEEHGRCQHCA